MSDDGNFDWGGFFGAGFGLPAAGNFGGAVMGEGANAVYGGAANGVWRGAGGNGQSGAVPVSSVDYERRFGAKPGAGWRRSMTGWVAPGDFMPSAQDWDAWRGTTPGGYEDAPTGYIPLHQRQEAETGHRPPAGQPVSQPRPDGSGWPYRPFGGLMDPGYWRLAPGGEGQFGVYGQDQANGQADRPGFHGQPVGPTIVPMGGQPGVNGQGADWSAWNMPAPPFQALYPQPGYPVGGPVWGSSPGGVPVPLPGRPVNAPPGTPMSPLGPADPSFRRGPVAPRDPNGFTALDDAQHQSAPGGPTFSSPFVPGGQGQNGTAHMPGGWWNPAAPTDAGPEAGTPNPYTARGRGPKRNRQQPSGAQAWRMLNLMGRMGGR